MLSAFAADGKDFGRDELAVSPKPKVKRDLSRLRELLGAEVGK